VDNGDDEVIGEFYSYLSDDSNQDAATTTAHMSHLIQKLMASQRIITGKSTIMEDTDGCAKQYRSATALYLLSMLALQFNVVIDRAVGAPGHGKDVVDGLNAVDKRFLRNAMFRILNPEETSTNNSMQSHSATSHATFSFAEECRNLLQNHANNVSSVLTSKAGKRERSKKFMSKHYHVQEKKNVPNPDVKMTWTNSCFKSLNIADGRSQVHGSATVLSHYHYRMDPMLGENKCLLRRIPCLCQFCNTQLKLAWIPGVEPSDQPRYHSSPNCIYASVLGGYNDWIIMQFKLGGNTTEDDLQDIHRTILSSIASNIAATITERSYGAVNTIDPNTQGFYIVKFMSTPYSLQQDMNVNGDCISSGELVCDAEYLSPAQLGSLWYVTPDEDTMPIVVEMSKVLVCNLAVNIVTELSDLDNCVSTLSADDLLVKQPFKLSDHDLNSILDEIRRREAMEYEIGDEDIIESNGV
jgi:hypothetical protein